MLEDDKKQEERAFAMMAAAILCEEWTLVASEHPDFIVSSPNGSFGLEVTGCFSGKRRKKGGSVSAQKARYRQETLNEIRERCLKRFPGIEYWSLDYIDEWKEICVEESIVSAIESALEDGGDGSFCFPISQSGANEVGILEYPKILINRSRRIIVGEIWRFMNDYAGSLQVSSSEFQRCIDEKSSKINKYRQSSSEIRLLVYAFSLESSMNVSIGKDFLPEIYDFDRVYFMHAPNYVREFPSGLVKTLTGRTPDSLS